MSKKQPKNRASRPDQGQPEPKRSWLEGPEVPGQYEDPAQPSTYAGENLGLPETGPGSLPGLFPRLGALLIDWLISLALTWLIIFIIYPVGDGVTVMERIAYSATYTFYVFVVWRTLTEWLFAQTPGHAIMGLGVVRVDDGSQRVGLWRSVVRVILTMFLFPPVIQDTDGRGMHDRATGTAVIRTR